VTSAKLFDLAGKRIYVAGHDGTVGSAIVRRLGERGCDLLVAGRGELDLERQEQAERFIADACVFVLEHYSDERHLNIGSGEEVTIAELARLVAEVVGYGGELAFDPARPDGMPRKLLDSSRLADLGWRARTSLRAGLERTYAAFLSGRYRDR